MLATTSLDAQTQENTITCDVDLITPPFFSGQTLSMEYEIVDRPRNVLVYTKDCTTLVDNLNALSITLITTSNGDDPLKVSTNLEINLTDIITSNIWSGHGGIRGTVDACIVMSIYLEPEMTTKLNFHETRLKFEVDSTGFFSAVETEEVDLVENFSVVSDTFRNAPAQGNALNFVSDVVAYMCDDYYQPTTLILSQGAILQVCVRSVDRRFEVDLIDELLLVKDKSDESEIRTLIISDNGGNILYEELTRLQCKKGMCQVKFNVLGSFFEEGEVDPVDVYIKASLSYFGYDPSQRVGPDTNILSQRRNTDVGIFNTQVRANIYGREENFENENKISQDSLLQLSANTAFICDDNLILSHKNLTQGDAVHVCVRASDSRYQVESIHEMLLWQDTPGSKSPNELLIISDKGSVVKYSRLTRTRCMNGICSARFQLLASFFEKSDIAYPIFVSGTVKLKYIGDGHCTW